MVSWRCGGRDGGVLLWDMCDGSNASMSSDERVSYSDLKKSITPSFLD